MAETSQETLHEDPFGSRMADLLTGMVRGLVDRPDAIHTEVDTEEATTSIRLYVAPDDISKVIGKQGRTARSLRTILNAIGSKTEQRISLDVLEDETEGKADEA